MNEHDLKISHAWRVEWTLDGWLMSPMTGPDSLPAGPGRRDVDPSPLRDILTQKAPNTLAHGPHMEAVCHPQFVGTWKSPHAPGTTLCSCGIYACTRPRDLHASIPYMAQFLDGCRSDGRSTPAIALTRYELADAIMVGGLSWGDPLSTCKGRAATVVGPIITYGEGRTRKLQDRYGVTVGITHGPETMVDAALAWLKHERLGRRRR